MSKVIDDGEGLPPLLYVECRHCNKQTHTQDEVAFIRKNGVYIVIMCEHCGLPLVVEIAHISGYIIRRGHVL